MVLSCSGTRAWHPLLALCCSVVIGLNSAAVDSGCDGATMVSINLIVVVLCKNRGIPVASIAL